MNQDDIESEDTNDEEEFDEEFEGVYVIDDDTADLLATAIGILQMMSQVQLGEDHKDNLLIIADEIQQRFAIEKDSITVEEVVTSDPETGEEEILYRPRGGVFGDDPSPEAEGPAVDADKP